jgi:tetratricopeptide (TPR) repeat protein
MKLKLVASILIISCLSTVSFCQTTKSARALFKSGKSKADANDFRGAIDDFTKALELQPNDPVIYEQRGKVEHHLRDYQAAIEDFTKAIELDSSFAKAYNSRGISYLMFNRRSKLHAEVVKRKAREDFMKAIELGFKVDQKHLDESE